MSSEADFAEFSSMFERMIQGSEGFARFLPMFLAALAGESESSDDDGQETGTVQRREIVIDPVNRRVVMIRSGTGGLEGLFNGEGKEGRSPASKASVESMPRVVIGKEGVEGEGSCSICLDEWSEGDVAAEMPCKHKFHDKCVEEWLGRQGTCPLCRYEMPVDEEQEEGKSVGVWIGFSVSDGGDDGRRRQDSNTRDETEA